MAHLRTCIRAAACIACLVASGARADELAAASSDGALSAIPGPVAPMPPPSSAFVTSRRKHVLGLQLDAGAPDGASASVLYRPVSFLRLGGGLLYNYAGYGVRGGVTVAPYLPVAPSLSFEVGHYFNANAASRLSQFTPVSDAMRMLLQNVGYTFAEASLGLEFGHPDWIVFFVRGGLSRAWLSVKNANAAAQQLATGNLRVSNAVDPSVSVNSPDVKVGFVLFIY